MRKDVIIVFTKYPIAGEVKTRLISKLGSEGAAELQRQMTEYTYLQAVATGAEVHVYYSGGSEKLMGDWLGFDGIYVAQVEGDIGQRMEHAFATCFKQGAERVVLVGCDCPDNRVANMRRCFDALKEVNCVFAPAVDGGYYMIGLSEMRSELFARIAWGSRGVLAQSIAIAKSYKLLEPLNDVDEVADIPQLISVVVPVLDEAENILRCVNSALTGFKVEVVVVDGGSMDKTVQIARGAGVDVYLCHGGRARQMNYGAEYARGAALVFLHGDSELPLGWDRAVRAVLRDTEVSLGYFKFRVKDRLRCIWLVEWFVALRCWILRTPYGDQGLFMSRVVFEKLGKYAEVPILEDLLLVQKAKKVGSLRRVGMAVLASGRRWQRFGVFRTTIYNQGVLLAARLGVDLEKLRQAYLEGRNPLWGIFKK